jgi:hypothetical protein
VLAWTDGQAVETLYLSAIAVAELRYGLEAITKGKRRTVYRERLERVVSPSRRATQAHSGPPPGSLDIRVGCKGLLARRSGGRRIVVVSATTRLRLSPFGDGITRAARPRLSLNAPRAERLD